MKENTIEMKNEVVVTTETTETPTDNAETTQETLTQVEEVKNTTEPTKATSRRRAKKNVEQVEIAIDETANDDNSEIENLKQQLAALEEMKNKLEQERNELTETVTRLNEEVKITPQKLGKAIKEMGISPLSVSRENPQGMSLEQYTAMTDSARREWQRTHRADYLKMMHNFKLNS